MTLKRYARQNKTDEFAHAFIVQTFHIYFVFGQRAVLDYLLSNPEQSCWVLDGYDEFYCKVTRQKPKRGLLDPEKPLPIADLISGLLNRQLLPGCTVLVTCRLRDVMDLEGPSDKVGQLLGWDHHQIKEYVLSFFGLKGKRLHTFIFLNFVSLQCGFNLLACVDFCLFKVLIGLCRAEFILPVEFKTFRNMVVVYDYAAGELHSIVQHKSHLNSLFSGDNMKAPISNTQAASLPPNHICRHTAIFSLPANGRPHFLSVPLSPGSAGR